MLLWIYVWLFSIEFLQVESSNLCPPKHCPVKSRSCCGSWTMGCPRCWPRCNVSEILRDTCFQTKVSGSELNNQSVSICFLHYISPKLKFIAFVYQNTVEYNTWCFCELTRLADSWMPFSFNFPVKPRIYFTSINHPSLFFRQRDPEVHAGRSVVRQSNDERQLDQLFPVYETPSPAPRAPDHCCESLEFLFGFCFCLNE